MTDPTYLSLLDGIAAVQRRDFARARGLLEGVATARADDARVWLWLALAAPSAAAAVPHLRRALSLTPDHPHARLGLSRLLRGLAEASSGTAREDARDLARQATDLDPNDGRAWVLLADLEDDEVARLDRHRQALAHLPENQAVRDRLQTGLVRRASALAKSGQRADAQSLLQEATALSPHDVRLWMALAQVAPAPADAVAALRRVLAIDASHSGAHTAIKKVLKTAATREQSEGRPAEALAMWREVCVLDATDVQAWAGRAELAEQAESVECATRLSALQPDHPLVARLLNRRVGDQALDAMRAGDMALALPLLREAVTQEEGNERLWSALGQATEDAAERIDAFRRVLVINPQQTRVAAVLKHTLVEQGQTVAESDPDRARAYFDEVIKLDAKDEAAWLGLASIEREPTSLLQLLGEAHRCNPGNTSTSLWMDRVKREGRQSAATAAVAATPAAGAPRATILIVDDSPTVRKILSLTLEKEGYKVVAANDGVLALAALGSLLPDLIFLDITMPTMDGYEVCRRIRKNPRTASVPVVMLSGKDGFFDKVRGRMAGATEYLTKPFQAPEVLRSVAAHCS